MWLSDPDALQFCHPDNIHLSPSSVLLFLLSSSLFNKQAWKEREFGFFGVFLRFETEMEI